MGGQSGSMSTYWGRLDGGLERDICGGSGVLFVVSMMSGVLAFAFRLPTEEAKPRYLSVLQNCPRRLPLVNGSSCQSQCSS